MEVPSPSPPAPTSAPLASSSFEFSGGALCLDFVNTWGDRGRPLSDQLKGFEDLVAFAAQAGLVDDACRQALLAQAAADAAGSGQAFDTAARLRESLYALFAGTARDRELPARDLETLNAVLREALTHLRIEARAAPGSAPFVWRFEAASLSTAPLWPIARSAADLLVSPDLARVTQCDGSNCTWLFLDQSRTRNRRWCSMESCGNRAKARRHYRRTKS